MIFSLSQGVEVSDDVVKQYKLGFQLSALIVNIVKYTMIVVGALMILTGLVKFGMKRRNKVNA